MAGKTEKRFFDDEDFTKEHDELNIWLLNNWKSVITKVAIQNGQIFDEPWEIEGGRYDPEPVFQGYPPIFPDGCASGVFSIDHTKEPLIVEFDSVAQFKCAKCARTHYLSFEWKYPSIYEMESELESNLVKKGMAKPNDVPFLNETTWDFRHMSELTQHDIREEHAAAVSRERENEKRWREEKQKLYDLSRDLARKEALLSWKQQCLKQRWQENCLGPRFVAIFEIKMGVDSFGKVLRQCNLYSERTPAVYWNRAANAAERSDAPAKSVNEFLAQQRTRNTQLFSILITPDDRYDDAFKTAGISVYHPPDKINAEYPRITNKKLTPDDFM